VKTFILSIIVVWTMGGERHASFKNLDTLDEIKTIQECQTVFNEVQNNLLKQLDAAGASNVEVFGSCQMQAAPL
jgi:hypothetical protein